VNLRPSDVNQIGKRRELELSRDPDRPSTKFMPLRRRQDPKFVKVKGGDPDGSLA
jgi:hypothetical protein